MLPQDNFSLRYLLVSCIVVAIEFESSLLFVVYCSIAAVGSYADMYTTI
jgi:hypothetical protein